MVEQLKHECGVTMIRLLKPMSYYQQKYGTWRYGLDKLYLMMEKQHNRGQEGAGIACVNLDAPVGEEYMFRERAEGKDAITEIFRRVDDSFAGQLYMLFHDGKERTAICASLLATKQLESKESLSLRELQHDKHR